MSTKSLPSARPALRPGGSNYRKLPQCQTMTRSGRWQAIDIWPIRRLKNQVLGIVGFGKIGRTVARKAKCLGMRVVANDPYCTESEMNEEKVESVNFDDLVGSSDFISLHVPLLPETTHLINERELKMMKTTAILINTSRGPILKEKSLVKALEEKWIFAAGLDVYENEPEISQRLKKLDNVVLMPHTASATYETRAKMAVMTSENMIAGLKGKIPPNCVNLEVFKKGKNIL